MTSQTDVKLTANGYGAQPHLGADILDDSGCPLTQGQWAAAHVIDGIGILLTDTNPDHDDLMEAIDGRY